MSTAEEAMEHLRDMFEHLEQFLKLNEFDNDLQEELSAAYPDYMTVLKTAKRDLLRSDCGIVITGATSAGKTFLVNLLIEKEKEKLFVSRNLASTKTVCRIRNSETMELRVFSKDDVLLKTVKADDIKQLKSTIKKFTDISQLQDEVPDAYYVDVYLPVPILKGNVIIVDTPGIGETEDLNKMLMDFLPHAVSFVFVVNARDAGGIHEDRLLKILTTIMQNRDKMPCFDPRDVMFLTNQWDIIENDCDDDEEETEHERTWQNIKQKLEKGWGSVKSNNLFRVSLKQVATQMKTEFTEDYARFNQVLKEIIDKNKNKRIQFYYSFFETFTLNAERGTRARLQMLERSANEQDTIVKANRQKIAALTKECNQVKKNLYAHKKELTLELAKLLLNYLNSSYGKDMILNPPGCEKISSISYGSLHKEIPRRVESGIKRWCESDEVKAKMEEADAKIRSLLQDIEEKLQNLEMGFIGLNLHHRKNKLALGFKILGLGFLFLLPFSYIFAFAFAVVFAPIAAVWGWFTPEEWHEDKVNEIYCKCLQSLKREALIESFEKSIGIEYEKVIVHIFDETIPRKLTSLEKLNEKLLTEQKKIKTKSKSFETLKEKMDSLRKKTDVFTQKCGWLSDA